ncbi:MAG: OmpA family protein [Paludibacteraceae bacterium]|nr:OmpA family protein [Paludibacteraceae bacterium]
MKKSIVIALLSCLPVFLLAQESQEVKGAHPYKTEENKEVAQEFAHWSITPHVGFNYFDGDFNSEMKHAVSIPNAGLSLEYAFTPVWALGIDYMFDTYTVTGNPAIGDHADTLLNGYMHKVGAYLSMDLMNLFYPRAERKIFSLHGLIGGGHAWYKNNIMYTDETRYHTASHTPKTMDEYGGALYLQAGVNAEFNLSRTVALGVRATYNYFINDYFDGRGYTTNHALASKNNDGVVDVTLNMRFKLEAVSKTHVRNISSLETFEKNEPILIHDTLIIQRDTTIIREVVKPMKEVKQQSQIYYVYFDSNKDEVRNDGLVTIQQVADRLSDDPSLYAVVTGYCDNTGSDKLNYALGDRRAANVMDELCAEHGVENSKVYSTGVGRVVGKRSKAAYGPNRRVAIRLVDEATFNRMKAQLEQKRAERGEEQADDAREVEEPAQQAEQSTAAQVEQEPTLHTIPLAESARQKKVNEYAQRAHENVKAEKNITLSKLARKYYDNTYCWVYIYIANKDRIKNANNVPEGLELIIPELTAEEMQITKTGSLELYNAARQNK